VKYFVPSTFIILNTKFFITGYFESNNIQQVSIVYDGNNAFVTTVQDKKPFIYIFNVDIEQAKLSPETFASIKQSLNLAEDIHFSPGWLDKNNIMIKVEAVDADGTEKMFDMSPSWKLSDHVDETSTVEPKMVTSTELVELRDKIKGKSISYYLSQLLVHCVLKYHICK